MSEDNQLGSLLIARGLLTPEQLDAALEEQQQTHRSLGRILIDKNLVTEAGLVSTLATQLGLEYVDVADYPVDPSATTLITDALARRYQALPIGWQDGRLLVAMADPSNVFAVDDIRTITGAEVKMVVSTRASILAAIDKYHRLDTDAESISAQASSSFEAEDDLTSVREVTEDAPIVKLVNLLITQAVQDRASDIHIEPGEHDLRVRYRIDGVLHEVMRPPKNIQSGIVSRLKIMADINIAERRVPQDGRISATIGGRAVDLRVATLPTVYGEKVVMRILDKSTALLRLDDLGFLPANRSRFEQAYRQPYGTILVTGPTGSGKSTTLYATLNIVNDESKNVITVEDPVEYRLPGINQVQVNTKAGLTFAAALRSILRSDPDIVLIGEIRDVDTAKIAMEAALSGHLVLTTLHTNTAAATPLRLTEMGIEPFLVTSALGSVLTQRLARVLCQNCKEPYDASEQEFLAAGYSEADLEGVETSVLHRAVGCRSCGHTGYQGRMVLAEVMNISEEIDRMIIAQSSIVDMERKACEQGMRTLRQDGLLKAVTGQTTLEEVLRVVV